MTRPNQANDRCYCVRMLRTGAGCTILRGAGELGGRSSLQAGPRVLSWRRERVGRNQVLRASV